VRTQTFEVNGMTCSHCVSAVTSELQQLPGVIGVSVALVPTGMSTVTVESAAPVGRPAVEAALDEAGDYALAPDAAATPGSHAQEAREDNQDVHSR
jgi:copper chaperone CopZ